MKHVVLVAHGSRSDAWAAPFRKLETAIQAACEPVPVTLAFMELCEPRLEAVLENADSNIREVHVVPLFMSSGGHVDRDIGAIVEAARTKTSATIHLHAAIGELPAVVDAMVKSVQDLTSE